ncbi:sensor histidine kinase [Pseudonocardia sp. GCM10023141]|uniref:sensor histidine kinase n=1 Tax=Pseudonocardia sp. GCM10023141 TaxID=3252653 RepID=UPI003616FB3F
MSGALPQPWHIRLHTRHWIAIDVVVALGSLVFVGATAQPGPPVLAGYALVGAATVPIAVRRRWPLPAFGAVLAADAAGVLTGVTDGPLPTVAVVVYTVASLQRRPVAIGALVVAVLVDAVLAFPVPGLPGTGAAGGVAVPFAALTVAAWCLGITARSQREYTRARLAEAADRVAAQERLRIARELHDVVANGMSLVALQAGVAGYVLDSRPEEARRALTSIEETSRASLDELRRMLPVLRGAPGPDAVAPGPDAVAMDTAPGLADLAVLVERSGRAGLAVTLDVRGVAQRVPTGLGLSAYRIVQEALTNVVRHAGATTVTVEVEHGRSALTVSVTDDGRGSGRADAPGGHGLLGMRERVAVYGGTLVAGPVEPPRQGFRVRAVLPLQRGDG